MNEDTEAAFKTTSSATYPCLDNVDADLFEGPKEDICSLGDLDLRHCLHCNSTNKEYISLPALTGTSFDDMTVSIWAKIFSHNPDMHNRTYLYDLRGDNSWSNQGLSLCLEQVNGRTEVHYAISYAPRKWTELCAVIPSPINKWTHFAFVRQGLNPFSL